MGQKTSFELLDSFHRGRVLVLGDIMLDRYIYGSVERISPEAPIPVVIVQRTADMPGGAANVARNIATLGGQATLIGVVGKDDTARDLNTRLSCIPNIRTELITDNARPTTVKIRHIADRQQILRSDYESTLPLSTEIADLLLGKFQAAVTAVDIVILSDYAKGVLSPVITEMAIAAAMNANKPVLVDPKGKSFGKYMGATYLTPNRKELELVCGHECSTDEQVVAGANAILEQGICSAIVVTRGMSGMSIVGRDGQATHIRTIAKEVFDVSGAGDTAVAAMSLSLAAGADIKAAANLANAAAGVVVGKYGTSTVTTAEIMASLDPIQGNDRLSKYFTVDNALRMVRHWRDLGQKIAFTNGCFDLLHPGHVSLLHQARAAADRLIVGLNSDLSVSRLKGPGRPMQGEIARATMLASLKSVDAVVLFEEDTPIKLIETLEPDVLVKGADYRMGNIVGADFVVKRGGRVLIADLVPGHSTTNTISRITTSSGV
jgi:D-beta-D-heptose 7-phosphate kinase/D-beta-D-heptose 1-phosphate adenosyltransferase